MIKENKQITIALIQASMDIDADKTRNHFANLIQKAAKEKVDLICLPELFTTQYFAYEENKDYFKYAEPIPGPTSQFLQEQAKINRTAILGGSFYEKTDNEIYYNTSLTVDSQGEFISKYRKMHIPQDPHYFERFYFTPGNLGYVDASINGINIAPLICYDQWFPEPARILALRGIHLICYPTAIGWFPELQKQEPFSAKRWEAVMRAHASMNGIYVAAINRIGTEGKMTFWGGSFIADPYGEVIARASNSQEEILIATIKTEKIVESQEGWGFLKYRRPDSYSTLTELDGDQLQQ